MGVQVIGLLGTGEMGSALGARLRAGGVRVVVALEGRSERTRAFAREADLEDVGSLLAVLGEAEVVLTVVPPGEAARVADAVAASVGSNRPLVAELNAISPQTVVDIAGRLTDSGLELVDGSISGPPPHRAGTTTLYLSGERADEVARLPFVGVERVVVGEELGLASAVKMCTASVYKGRVAILAQALRTAHAHGVLEPVLADLVATGIVDRERVGATLARASAKAWRYVAEMDEIARTQESAGLTPDLFEAFAAVYAGLAARPAADAPEEVPDTMALDEVLARFAGAESLD